MNQREAKRLALKLASDWMQNLIASGNWNEIAELNGDIRSPLSNDDADKVEYELEQIWDRLYQRYDNLGRKKAHGKK